MIELKPCPFCGGEAVMHERWDSLSKLVEKKAEVPKTGKIIRSIKYASGKLYYEYREKIFIPQCCNSYCVGRSQKPFKSRVEAIEAWNSRAGEEDKHEID